MAALIEIADLSIAFDSSDGSVHALDRVSLDIEEGAFVCIVGPSGCGKTSLIAALAGFLPPTSGSVRLRGVPSKGPGADRGFVFQQPLSSRG